MAEILRWLWRDRDSWNYFNSSTNNNNRDDYLNIYLLIRVWHSSGNYNFIDKLQDCHCWFAEILRCRNSWVNDVKSANVACGESAIYTQVTKIDTEILYIRNSLSVVFACHKTVWVSHGASPKDSVVWLRLIAGGHCQLFIQVEHSKLTRVTRLTTHYDAIVATQIVFCDVT